MTISELIEALEICKSYYGDLMVINSYPGKVELFNEILGIRVLPINLINKNSPSDELVCEIKT